MMTRGGIGAQYAFGPRPGQDAAREKTRLTRIRGGVRPLSSAVASRERTAFLLRDQAAYCTAMGSPLYAHLLERAAADAEAGGAVQALLVVLGPLRTARTRRHAASASRSTQSPSLLIMAMR